MKNTILLITVFAFSFSVSAQFPTSLSDRLETILNVYDNPNSPFGVSVAVNIADYGTWESTIGFSHTNTVLETSMLLGIGSNTKLFTSVLCMKLQENGQLDLDDPISTWLPTYQNINPNITLRQLLQHASGLDDYVNYLMPDTVVDSPNHSWTQAEVLAYVGPSNFNAGTSVAYSSTNYFLAGMILEEVTNRTYTQLIHDSILTPMGLTDVYVEGFENIPSVLAHPWHEANDLSTDSRIALSTVAWSAGCIVATPKNMADWYMKLFNTNFLDESSILEMTNFIPWPSTPYEMGLGVYTKASGDVLWGHSGQTIGYNSLTYFHPEQEFSISVIINDTYKSPGSVTASLITEIVKQLTILGTSEIDHTMNGCQVFPNPVNHSNATIIIEGTERINNLKVLDLQGSVVIEETNLNANEVTLNTMNLEAGIYIIVIESNSNVYSKQLIIQ